MTGRTHDLAAISFLGVTVIFISLPTMTLSTLLLSLLANQIGGIAPDIDQPTAPLWRNLPIGHFFGKVTDKLLGGHRFLTHSILGLAIFGFLAYELLSFIHPLFLNINIGLIWWSFMIGMFSHLVMDSFTKEGVPCLLPLPIKFGFPPIKKFRITTGHKAEFLGVFPLLLIIDIWLCKTYYAQILFYMHHLLIY